mgnify:CR=1 FL=1
MADIAELGLKINSQPVEQAGTKLKNFGKIASDTERKAVQATNGMSAGFSSFNKNMATTEPAIKRVETNLKNFKLISERSLFPRGGAALTAIKDFRVELERVPSGTGQAVTAISSIEKTAKTATATSGNFSNSIRQISLQLSQVAQQGAVTGDFFRAFTVQLPDLLLGFGTFGILIGAVAGALGGPLLDALTATNSETDKLFKDIREGNKDIERLGDAQRELFTKEQTEKIKETREGIQDYTEKLGDAEKALVDLRTKGKFDSTGFFPRFKKADQEDLDEAESKVLSLRASLESQNQTLKEQEEVLERVADANKKAYEQRNVDRKIEEQSDLLRSLEATTEAIERAGSTQTEIAVRAAAERNSILAAAYNEDLISFGEYQEQRVNNQLNLQAELTEIEKRGDEERSNILTASQQKTLGFAGQLFGNLASIAREGGEDQFQEYKNLASAQAGISAALAITNVLATPGVPYPLAVGLAASMGALTAVQIAKIQGQEYQSSRASGGQAKGRVLVGENGPEILNMGNSTGSITSAAGTKKEMQGQTVQQIFNISPGLSGAIQAEIERAIPLMAKVAVSSVSGDIRRGGSTAKAVGIR